MELNQLRYFQKTAHLQNMTKAARELFISQSTLSQCMARLEADVGCSLFIRRKGKLLQLSTAGQQFLEMVDRVLEELDRGVAEVRHSTGQGTLHISVVSATHELCDKLLLDFMTSHRDIRIAHRLFAVNYITDILLTREADMAITFCPLDDERLDCLPLYRTEMLLAVGPNHPLVGQKFVRRRQLLGESFICNFAEADRYFLEMIFLDHPVNIIMECGEPATIRALVERDVGVAFMPAGAVMRNILEDGTDPARFIRISDYVFDVPTCISKRKESRLSPPAAQFWAYAVDFCQREDETVKRFLGLGRWNE